MCNTNNNKLQVEPSLKEKGTIVKKKKKKAEKSYIRTCICSVHMLQFLKSVT